MLWLWMRGCLEHEGEVKVVAVSEVLDAKGCIKLRLVEIAGKNRQNSW